MSQPHTGTILLQCRYTICYGMVCYTPCRAVPHMGRYSKHNLNTLLIRLSMSIMEDFDFLNPIIPLQSNLPALVFLQLFPCPRPPQVLHIPCFLPAFKQESEMIPNGQDCIILYEQNFHGFLFSAMEDTI